MHFDRVILINLERRPDRLRDTLQLLADAGNPFGTVKVFPAHDGRDPPGDWQRAVQRWGPGVYGCYRSHREIWRLATAHRHSVLILEDDIALADDFAERFPRFVASVPDDWQGIYLGAEHKDPNTDQPMPPMPIAPGIARCRMPMRTHAYGLRGPLLTQLTMATERHRWHIDHAIGATCGEFPVYCADPPLVGQRAGGSDVGQGLRATPEFWG